MEKDFLSWHHIKVHLDGNCPYPTFQERDIWWCKIGMNVGFEIFGKGDTFTRPILVLRKFSKYTFLGVPLSTVLKDTPYYYPLKFKGKEIRAVLDQTRMFDSRRLASYMGQLNGHAVEKIKVAYKKML